VRSRRANRSGPEESDAGSGTGADESTESYRRYTEGLLAGRDDDELAEAMAVAIGASSVEEFHRSGQLELDLLVQSGLRPEHHLVDVGCGSGRLTSKLAAAGHAGLYLGTELTPDLLEFARRGAPRPDWRFELVDGLEIPADDESVDMVCFFSVLTHLRHEESFLYLEEARRVLVPGGRVVFSFLYFSQGNHLSVFRRTVAALRAGEELHVNQFVSVDGVLAWAKLLGMYVEAVHPGAARYIELSESPYYEPGETLATLGQSACVMVKPG
jgi:ubiquinone/menaquinone biosynthesis C-methylase UbiE